MEKQLIAGESRLLFDPSPYSMFNRVLLVIRKNTPEVCFSHFDQDRHQSHHGPWKGDVHQFHWEAIFFRYWIAALPLFPRKYYHVLLGQPSKEYPFPDSIR